MQRMYTFSKGQNESDENFDFPPDNEPTLSSSYFHEEPLVNVETIKERLKGMDLHRLQKNGEELLSQEYDKDKTVQ